MTDVPEPTRYGEPVWLEPYPDALLAGIPDDAPGPAARYDARESIALAFVVGLQRLPPQQRAVLVLRDVLGFRAAEVAEMLDTTEHSVNSLLRRARAAFESRLPTTGRDRAPRPNFKLERDIVGSFADAIEAGDIDGVVAIDPSLMIADEEPDEQARRHGEADPAPRVGPSHRRRLGDDAARALRVSGRRCDRRVPARPYAPTRRAAARTDARQRLARVRLLLPDPTDGDRAAARTARPHPRGRKISAITWFADSTVFPASDCREY
jgi:Sigma-70, region 4